MTTSVRKSNTFKSYTRQKKILQGRHISLNQGLKPPRKTSFTEQSYDQHNTEIHVFPRIRSPKNAEDWLIEQNLKATEQDQGIHKNPLHCDGQQKRDKEREKYTQKGQSSHTLIEHIRGTPPSSPTKHR